MRVGTIHVSEFKGFVQNTTGVTLPNDDIAEIAVVVNSIPFKPDEAITLFKGGIIIIILPPNLGEDSDDEEDNDSAWPIVERANDGNHPVIVITYGNGAQNYHNNRHMDNARYKGYFTIDTLSNCIDVCAPLNDVVRRQSFDKAHLPMYMYTNVYVLRQMTKEEQRDHDDRMDLEFSPFDASLLPTETPPHLDL
jgi:hypothetical protein